MPTRFVPFVVYIRKSSDSLHRLGAVSKIVLCCPSFEQGGIHEMGTKQVSCEFVDRTWQEDLKIADTL